MNKILDEYLTNTTKNEFFNLVSEEIHNIGCSETVSVCVKKNVKEYLDSHNRYNLVMAGATIMAMCIELCADGSPNCKPVSWASMDEFSGYPLTQRTNVFLDT